MFTAAKNTKQKTHSSSSSAKQTSLFLRFLLRFHESPLPSPCIEHIDSITWAPKGNECYFIKINYVSPNQRNMMLKKKKAEYVLGLLYEYNLRKSWPPTV